MNGSVDIKNGMLILNLKPQEHPTLENISYAIEGSVITIIGNYREWKFYIANHFKGGMKEALEKLITTPEDIKTEFCYYPLQIGKKFNYLECKWYKYKETTPRVYKSSNWTIIE